MRFFILSLVAFLSFEANALQMIKCGSVEGKTLYGTFGKRGPSGPDHKIVYFPIEFTVFAGRQTLQDRIIYDRTEDALKIPLMVSDPAISFSFPAKSVDGRSLVTETFQLRLISPKDLRGYQGSWVTTDAAGQVLQSVFTMCSAYR